MSDTPLPAPPPTAPPAPSPTPAARPVAPAGPTPPAGRIASIDVLRGVAVLGILVMNIQSFGQIGSCYVNPMAAGPLDTLDLAVWSVVHTLAATKFMTIFSLLFGAGVVLMTARREALGQDSAGVHYLRTFWLLIFGLLHAHLLWPGDVLYFYALSGFVIYPLRRCRPATLIVLGVCLLGIASAIALAFHFSMPFWPANAVENLRASWSPSPRDIDFEIAIWRGSWVEQFTMRTPSSIFMETVLLVLSIGWQVTGLMLIGMALFKLGAFNAAWQPRAYAIMVALAAVVGVPVIVLGLYQYHAHDWSMEYSFFGGGQFNYWGGPLVAGGWIGLVMLWCRSRIASRLRGTVAAVGRMALTNYLGQTVICTTLFYGHGLGLFECLTLTQLIGVVPAIWLVQLVVSPLWLSVFRFGPMEWLWRSLTYLRWQPILRQASL